MFQKRNFAFQTLCHSHGLSYEANWLFTAKQKYSIKRKSLFFLLVCVLLNQIPEKIRITCIIPSKINYPLAQEVGSTSKHMKMK